MTCSKDLTHCTNTVFRDHEITFVSLLVPLPAPAHTRCCLPATDAAYLNPPLPAHTRRCPPTPAATRPHPPTPAHTRPHLPAHFWLPALQQLGCCREQGECVGCGGASRRVCVGGVGRRVCRQGCVSSAGRQQRVCVRVLACRGVVVVWLKCRCV